MAPSFGAMAWAAFARAMISAKDRFFGSGLGPTVAVAVILAAVVDGTGRLPFDEVGAGLGFEGVSCPFFVIDDVPALSLGRGAEADLRFFDDDARGLSGIRDVDDGWVLLVRPAPFVAGVVRGVFAADPESSASAFRFKGGAGLFAAGAGEDGFSPVMDASRSPIYGWRRHISVGSSEERTVWRDYLPPSQRRDLKLGC